MTARKVPDYEGMFGGVLGFHVSDVSHGFHTRVRGNIMPLSVARTARPDIVRAMMLKTAEGVVETLLARGWTLGNDGWRVTFKVPYNGFMKRVEGMECELDIYLRKAI